MEQLLRLQQDAIVILKLAAYAADTMRVLMVFEQHAEMSKAIGDVLKGICPDWRNPGAIEQPADLIAMALAQAIATLQQVNQGMEQALACWQPPMRAT